MTNEPPTELESFFSRDIKETQRLSENIPLLIRMIKRSVFQPLFHPILKQRMRKRIGNDKLLDRVDIFLLDQGGMYKKQVIYRICNDLQPIKGSIVLFPGVCKGDGVLQLASLRPKRIVAFDPYKFYSSHMDFLKKECRDRFGVEFTALHGDVDCLLDDYASSFDFVVSNSVLEHVRDLKKFLDGIKTLMKSGGVFCAGFGPIWYGPGGDHGWYKPYDDEMIKEVTRDYIHLFRPASTYAKGMFSKLSAEEYFDIFREAGYGIKLTYASVSSRALKMLGQNKALDIKMTSRNIPQFDRYCLGLYVWMQKN